MKLAALSEQWAVYELEGKYQGTYDTFSALSDLLQIKSYEHLINYLKKYTCNAFFTSGPDLDLHLEKAVGYKYSYELNTNREIKLSGDLLSTTLKHTDVDLLDDLTLNDYRNQPLCYLSVRELIDFRDIMLGFLSYAAVAIGSTPREDMFQEIKTTKLENADEIERLLGSNIKKIHTIACNQHSIGIQDKGLLAETAFCSFGGITTIEPDKKYGTFASTKIVLDYIASGDINDPNSCCDTFIISFPEDVPSEYAQELLAGKIIETLLNNPFPDWEMEQFSYPDYSYYHEEDFKEYHFVSGQGFLKRSFIEPKWWIEDLYFQAISLIADKKVSLCPICGAPFVTRDKRGCKPKMVCSDSCKTKSSNQRREKALYYAAAGMPIKEAIEKIGIDYAPSIKKWYKEANTLNR